MTALPTTTLFCDGPGRYYGKCRRTFNCGFRAPGSTRYRASKAGWTHKFGDTDYCPECTRKVNNDA